MNASSALLVVRLVHTLAWAVFAGAIIALPVAAFRCRFDVALLLAGLVACEIAILACNRWACPLTHWACPLTHVAARYTRDRRDNFDIYLPAWLARYNKALFGTWFVLGLVYTGLAWRRCLDVG